MMTIVGRTPGHWSSESCTPKWLREQKAIEHGEHGATEPSELLVLAEGDCIESLIYDLKGLDLI